VSAALAAGLLAGYGVALPVGAVGAYLVALTARTSLRTGAFAALGVATADGVYAVIAVCWQGAATPGHADQAVFVVAVFVASASWQLVLAGGGAFLGRLLTGSRGRLVTGLASSALIGVLAVHLLVTASLGSRAHGRSLVGLRLSPAGRLRCRVRAPELASPLRRASWRFLAASTPGTRR
jgi:arginine exporter protein ArgO